ncbi:hypothetical protein HDA39_006606 [Kribbella italica]|uniref:Uncharacterized protein n=1 Tax=Kribbella italica TaxID=1540520 RepID=A0A7W9JCZ1_9ACTN|nr:hypothetical protein [Kribbella italica]
MLWSSLLSFQASDLEGDRACPAGSRRDVVRGSERPCVTRWSLSRHRPGPAQATRVRDQAQAVAASSVDCTALRPRACAQALRPRACAQALRPRACAQALRPRACAPALAPSDQRPAPALCACVGTCALARACARRHLACARCPVPGARCPVPGAPRLRRASAPRACALRLLRHVRACVPAPLSLGPMPCALCPVPAPGVSALRLRMEEARGLRSRSRAPAPALPRPPQPYASRPEILRPRPRLHVRSCLCAHISRWCRGDARATGDRRPATGDRRPVVVRRLCGGPWRLRPR